MAPPNFGRSVNTVSTNGGRLCPQNNTGSPRFSAFQRLSACILHTCPNSFSENRSRGCSSGIVLGRSITYKSSSTCHNWITEFYSRTFIHSKVAEGFFLSILISIESSTCLYNESAHFWKDIVKKVFKTRLYIMALTPCSRRTKSYWQWS